MDSFIARWDKYFVFYRLIRGDQSLWLRGAPHFATPERFAALQGEINQTAEAGQLFFTRPVAPQTPSIRSISGRGVFPLSGNAFIQGTVQTNNRQKI